MFKTLPLVFVLFAIFSLSSIIQVYTWKSYLAFYTNMSKSILSIIIPYNSTTTTGSSGNNASTSINSVLMNHVSSSLMNVSYSNDNNAFYPITRYLQQQRNKTVIYTYFRGSGFANRLRSMRGILILAMLNNANFCINYDNYYSIMDNQLSIMKCKRNISGEKWDVKYTKDRFQQNPCNYQINRNIEVVTFYDILEYLQKCVNFTTDLRRNNPYLQTDNLVNYLSRFFFRPKPYITNYGNSVLSRMNGTKVGIQLRFGGNSAYAKEPHSFLNPERMDILVNRTKSLLQKIKDPYTLFLSSDSPLAKQMILSLHVPYVTAEKYAIGHTNRDNFTHLQRAITDLYILSKCNVVLFTRYSSYGEMARILSNPHSYNILYN